MEYLEDRIKSEQRLLRQAQCEQSREIHQYLLDRYEQRLNTMKPIVCAEGRMTRAKAVTRVCSFWSTSRRAIEFAREKIRSGSLSNELSVNQ
jgi:hypothetical protein